ncbi:MAG: DUF2079 domain-containing protein [Candidatus Eremiobacteraeota bacterium]|nr:DUF2079 domain-containing protein [Candidatus Eremiobacteraeota bacterium]
MGPYVWLGALLYAVVYFVLGAVRYETYHSGSDLGLFTQSISSAFRGFANTPEGGNHFTFHFSPILYVCAPILDFTRSPLALVALQAVAGALTAPPLYLIARRRMPERLAAAVAGIALVYPPLAGVTFTDFHENGFVPAATLWLLYAVDARRLPLAAVLLIVTLGIKEDQGPILAFASAAAAVYFLRERDRERAWFAAFAFVACIVTFGAFFTLVRPLAGARDAWSPTHFYTWNRIVDPRGSAAWNSIGRPAYFLEALVPLVFVPVASPAFLLAVPGFVEDLGSHESITYTMGQHYAAVWIPYVLFAFVLAVARARRRSPAFATRLVAASAVLCVSNLAFASPTHWGHYLRGRNAHDAALDRAIGRLPRDAFVGTSDEVYAHLGFDPYAHLGLRSRPTYVLVDEDNVTSWFYSEWHRPLPERNARIGPYHLLWTAGDVDLYERAHGTP